MHAMIKGWHDAGRKVHVLAMNTSRHYVSPAELPRLYREIAGFHMVDVATDIRLLPTLRNFFFSNQPEHASRFYIPAFAVKLMELVGSLQPEMIQMESIYLSGYLPQLRRISKAVMVQRLHNIEYEVWRRLSAETINPLKSAYLNNLASRIQRYEQESWSAFDLLLPITEADTEYIRRSGCRTPLHTVPFGIEMDHLPEPEGPESWSAYHLGAMDWRPNQEAMQWFARDIWPLIRKAAPGCAFYMAGRNMPESFYKYESDTFHCAGEVPDANTFIADKKILVVPLRSGGGIRVKTLEAMAAGKLVISTGTGIQGIAANDKEHYLLANTPEAFAAAIAWALSHKTEALKIAANARQLLHEQYDQQLIMKALAAVVDNLT